MKTSKKQKALLALSVLALVAFGSYVIMPSPSAPVAVEIPVPTISPSTNWTTEPTQVGNVPSAVPTKEPAKDCRKPNMVSIEPFIAAEPGVLSVEDAKAFNSNPDNDGEYFPGYPWDSQPERPFTAAEKKRINGIQEAYDAHRLVYDSCSEKEKVAALVKTKEAMCDSYVNRGLIRENYVPSDGKTCDRNPKK